MDTLHFNAASNNHLEVVRYFINEQHCDPITRNNDGDTPFHIACNYGNAHIVQYLLSTGKVDPLARNKNGKTPMYRLNSLESVTPTVRTLTDALHYTMLQKSP